MKTTSPLTIGNSRIFDKVAVPMKTGKASDSDTALPSGVWDGERLQAPTSISAAGING